MVDYTFYVNTYLGSAIPEDSFPGIIQQAQRSLDRFKRLYQVSGSREAEKLALCAMAEELYAWLLRPAGVVSAGVGKVSIRYVQDQKRCLERQLYAQALLYLDIYRGVN